MIFNYCSAPCGAGKTFGIIEAATSLVRSGENVLIVQPTRRLIDCTADQLLVSHDKIYGDDNRATSTISAIYAHLKSPRPEPHVLLITSSAFELLPHFPNPGIWHLFVDEVPQVHDHVDIPAAETHCYITDHVISRPVDEAFALLMVRDALGMRRTAELGSRDDGILRLSHLARRMIRGWDGYVDQAQHHRLLGGGTHILRLFLLLNPRIFEGFASVTFVGARFEETPLFLLWRRLGHVFREHSDLKQRLRFSTHAGGETVTIKYGFNGEWSKTFRDQNDGLPFRLYHAAVKEVVGDQPLLWLANRDIDTDLFPHHVDAVRLPNKPHGLNEYQNGFRAVVSFSALNPASASIGFLKSRGLTPDEIRTSTHRHPVYQAALRSAIRNPTDQSEKLVVVPDRSTASWLTELIPGAQITPLPIDGELLPSRKKRGRPRKHASDADRKHAFRLNKQAKAKSAVQPTIAGFAGKADVTTLLSDGTKDHVANQQAKSRLDFHGSVWEAVHARYPSDVFEEMTHMQFIAELRRRSETHVRNKDDNQLVSPSFFVQQDGSSTVRGVRNVLFANGIWLDFEGGDLGPTDFSRMFPAVEFVAYPTFNSKVGNLRWRAYIPTDRAMSGDEYANAAKRFHLEAIRQGFNVSKRSVSTSGNAHGLDLGKLSPACLFFLPCDNGKNAGMSFQHYMKSRSKIRIDDWGAAPLGHQHPPIRMREPKGSVDRVAVDNAVRAFNQSGLMPGQGNSEMFKLMSALDRAGMSAHSARELAMSLAKGTTSPSDRSRQVEWYFKNQ